MWRTENGERILEGVEAKLFAETLLSLLDELFLNELDDYFLGIGSEETIHYSKGIPYGSPFFFDRGKFWGENNKFFSYVLWNYSHPSNQESVNSLKSCPST